MTNITTTQAIRDWRNRSIYAAMQSRDEYTISNILSSVAALAIRKHLKTLKRERSYAELQQVMHDALDDAIDALNQLKHDLLP